MAGDFDYVIKVANEHFKKWGKQESRTETEKDGRVRLVIESNAPFEQSPANLTIDFEDVANPMVSFTWEPSGDYVQDNDLEQDAMGGCEYLEEVRIPNGGWVKLLDFLT